MKVNLFQHSTFDSELIKINPFRTFFNSKYKYSNCGPRIQINPTKTYYGLEIQNTIYPSPKVYIMQNYNKFKHSYIKNLSKSVVPNIKYITLSKNKNVFKSFNTQNSIPKQNNQKSNIQIFRKNKVVSRNVRNIYLDFPYIKPSKYSLIDYFKKNKKIKTNLNIYKSFT